MKFDYVILGAGCSGLMLTVIFSIEKKRMSLV